MHQRGLAAIFIFVLSLAAPPVVSAAEVTVYKDPNCGCCSKWVDHLRANGFAVKSHDVQDVTPYEVRHGVPQHLGACHTAVVEGYAIEGHVPAQDIKRLLQERPNVQGLAVPGMPVGSPGMEHPGGIKHPYAVVTFDKTGKTTVYAEH